LAAENELPASYREFFVKPLIDTNGRATPFWEVQRAAR